jgi:hypothetical protein
MGLFVLQGQTNLKIGYQEYGMPKESWFVWDNFGPATRKPQAVPLELIQWWTNRSGPALTPERREMNVAVDELAMRVNRKPADILQVLAEELKDKKSKQANRVLAIYSLGACDATSALIDALQDPRTDVRETAILALRDWTSLHADRDLKLYKQLHDDKGYTWHHAEIVMTLLHSPSEEAIRKPDTYVALLAYLQHDKLAIRELGWWHLSRLDPDGAKEIPFDPAGPSEQRAAVVAKWKQRIPEGKVPPRLAQPGK